MFKIDMTPQVSNNEQIMNLKFESLRRNEMFTNILEICTALSTYSVGF